MAHLVAESVIQNEPMENQFKRTRRVYTFKTLSPAFARHISHFPVHDDLYPLFWGIQHAEDTCSTFDVTKSLHWAWLSIIRANRNKSI